ncbi:MAG TPA: hypothetical protein VLS27_20540 [Gammaproteobacteria bacterium]|nr:hypothetical protein [Gammaproteobacteria bacterium]
MGKAKWRRRSWPVDGEVPGADRAAGSEQIGGDVARGRGGLKH